MNLKEQLELYRRFKEIGQSLWIDSISRDMILRNLLKNLIDKYEITGLTSNPTIFENAIVNSNSYDESLKLAFRKFSTTKDIAYSLMIEDIERACDMLSDIFKKTSGNDGYVSIEIPPDIDDTKTMIDCALKIHEMVSRNNLMIKIPATSQGISAFKELTKRGLNINVTLIFSPKVYEEVCDAYISAIKWRCEHGLSGDVFSVASFFVSRIDGYVNEKLNDLTQNLSIDEKNKILSIKGRVAISVALMAYEIYLKKFFSDEFAIYKEKGFRPQKLLWASTSTKDPIFKDTLYVDELCLKHTINTIPYHTLLAFFEHGNINTQNIEERIKAAKEVYKIVEGVGIDWDEVFDFLLKDGLKRFIVSYENILKAIENKRKLLTQQEEVVAQVYNISLKDVISEVEKNNFKKRLFEKDATLWKKEKAVHRQIKNSLGWLDLPIYMKDKIDEIVDFAKEIENKGFKYVVLLGMGGSSLASQVISDVFGNNKIKFYVLDSTHPDRIFRISKQINILKTLFIVSSKSGTTLETMTQFRYFYYLLKSKTKNPQEHFIAITDKGTPLEELAKKYRFRRIFINPSDIGGRFSAISYFGLVPAAFTKCDIKKLILRAELAYKEIQSKFTLAYALGSFLAKSYRSGRDKLTLIVPKNLESFGLWIEQLIAESTGKEGKGMIPIIETEIHDPDTYQDDRLFVVMCLKKFEDNSQKVNELIKMSYPVFKIYLDDYYDIGREFYRWEFATALFGHLIGINPFDQPDVQFTKEFTKKILDSNVKMIADIKKKNESIYLSNVNISSSEPFMWQILKSVPDNGYLALCVYLDENERINTILKDFKSTVSKLTGIATIGVFGPRYLHSIGQLFKGGKDNGIVLILTSKPKKDIKVVREGLDFARIIKAQSYGDFLAMKEKGKRCVLIEAKDGYGFLRRMLKEIKTFAEISKEEEGNMPKTTTRSKKQSEPKKNAYVVIDYPRHLETITSRYYTIRIGASPTSKVEVSIDGGPWCAARESVGYWWYDWNDITPGTHEIIARIQVGDTYITSKRRRCKAVV